MDRFEARLVAQGHSKFYMLEPEGFVDPKRPNHVRKLKKSTYELINSQLIVGTLLWMSI